MFARHPTPPTERRASHSSCNIPASDDVYLHVVSVELFGGIGYSPAAASQCGLPVRKWPSGSRRLPCEFPEISLAARQFDSA